MITLKELIEKYGVRTTFKLMAQNNVPLCEMPYVTPRGATRRGYHVLNWFEDVTPRNVGEGYKCILDRLDGQVVQTTGYGLAITQSHFADSGRLMTTLITTSGQQICFQNEHRVNRAVSYCGEKMRSIDVSGSQLRIALAIRGRTLPFNESVWPDVVAKVEHPCFEEYPTEVKSRTVKVHSLKLVKEFPKYSILESFKNALEKCGFAYKGEKIVGLHLAISNALYSTYPELKLPISSMIPSETPDGFKLCQWVGGNYRRVHNRTYGVNTEYQIDHPTPPTMNNYLEGMEAYVLRRVICSMPAEAPLLTVHDEIVTSSKHLALASQLWEQELNKIAEIGTYKPMKPFQIGAVTRSVICM